MNIIRNEAFEPFRLQQNADEDRRYLEKLKKKKPKPKPKPKPRPSYWLKPSKALGSVLLSDGL